MEMNEKYLKGIKETKKKKRKPLKKYWKKRTSDLILKLKSYIRTPSSIRLKTSNSRKLSKKNCLPVRSLSGFKF